MLQVGFIRQQVELVKQRLAVKNFKQPELVDELLQWDDKRKQYQLEQEDIQAKLNTASKTIGQLMAKGEKEAAEQKKQEVAALKNSLDPEKLNEAEKNIQAILYLLPNLPSEKVPPGKTPEDNVIVREGGKKSPHSRRRGPCHTLGSGANNTISSILNWATRLPAAGSPCILARAPGCNGL